MSVYSQTFANSKIMEEIIPRKINSSEEMRSFNPYLLRSKKDYEICDIEAVNKVSLFDV